MCKVGFDLVVKIRSCLSFEFWCTSGYKIETRKRKSSRTSYLVYIYIRFADASKVHLSKLAQSNLVFNIKLQHLITCFENVQSVIECQIGL